MQIKIGDLVQIKDRVKSMRHNTIDLWLVIGWNNFNDYISIQNVHTGERCQYDMNMLKHFKSDKK